MTGAGLDLPASYLTLLKRSLLNDLYVENEAKIIYMISSFLNGQAIELNSVANIQLQSAVWATVDAAKESGSTITLFQTDAAGQAHYLPQLRVITDMSHTMMGRKRLQNLEFCLNQIVADEIPGDLIETGVWRGGGTIFMRGFLLAHGIDDRLVWVADSFAGLPPPSLPQDHGYDLSAAGFPSLAVDLDTVKALFAKYGLLDDQVRFLKGWFKDTLPHAPIERLSLLRLDGDLYESTMDALDALYAKVSPGGYVIVDDYRCVPPCAQATDDFRQRHGITEPLVIIDDAGVFWRKSLG